MRLMFVYYVNDDAGSAQSLYSYTHVARAQGHEVVIWGPKDTLRTPRPWSGVQISRAVAPSASDNIEPMLTYSPDVESADAVIFVLETLYALHPGGYLNLVRLMSKVPRQRRVIIDNDGMYNDVIRADGDYNHTDAEASRRRTALYDSLSDRIYQPTFHPRRRGVRTFFFHGYDPALERALEFRAKEYGMIYVGNNWFRWRPMHRLLQAIEPIRQQVGRIGVIGSGWETPPSSMPSPLREDGFRSDPVYLHKLQIELMPPVPVRQVIPSMSKGFFNPVLVRPLFNHLRLVNPRVFETLAASTIPLFGQDPQYIEEIYGRQALELVLPEQGGEEKILDILYRPQYYAEVVGSIRRHLGVKHSYAVRFQELIDIVES